MNSPDSTSSSKRLPLQKTFSTARLKESFVKFALFSCAFISVLVTAGIVFVLLNEAIFLEDSFFRKVPLWNFLTDLRWAPQQGVGFGIWPLLSGTLLITGIAASIGLPIGLMSAIYLSEYASPRTRTILKPMLEILAGIPTVVYGFFALVFITPFLIKPFFSGVLGFDVEQFNALSAGIVVGIMIIPMISSLSEDVLRAVPRGLREAGYALGATKFDVSMKIVVPAALSGILASFLLAISRAIGETMAVAIAAGSQARLTLNPLQGSETITAYIVNIAKGDAAVGSIEKQSLYALALSLFVITLIMNMLSQKILNRFREVYN